MTAGLVLEEGLGQTLNVRCPATSNHLRAVGLKSDQCVLARDRIIVVERLALDRARGMVLPHSPEKATELSPAGVWIGSRKIRLDVAHDNPPGGDPEGQIEPHDGIGTLQ
jgi:hypothetical protein